jgi:transposase
MDLRELKGLEIAARSRITFETGFWYVPSQSSNTKYKVNLGEPPSCTCEDFQLRNKPCKHIIAARIVCERDHNGKGPRIDTDAVPKRPTYKQNWPAYNLAQSTEKHRFQVLLADLCSGIEEPPPPKTGRRPHLVKDAIFAAVFKVYSTFSSRRFSCDLQDAFERGHTTKPIPGAKIPAFMDNEAFTPILQALIVRSSLPLRSVEVDFATDSSGFSTSRFVRWFDEKYGVHRSGHEWVKVHLACGVKTNVVTAVVIEDKNAADCPQFPALVNKTAENFTVNEFSGDKAYLSHDNLELLAKMGATAFIPFKVNSAAGEPGSVWEKMYAYFRFRREEFLAHYHKRSNVESTFSMIKAKFRDHVRSKTDVAMKNEVLCKVLCHNICCLIHAQCKLGIEPVFWAEESNENPSILKLTSGKTS